MTLALLSRVLTALLKGCAVHGLVHLPGLGRVGERLGGLGLILPAATGIAPILTPLAATGLATIMVLAVITHGRRKEPGAVVFNLVLFALAAVVAWGRFGPYGW